MAGEEPILYIGPKLINSRGEMLNLDAKLDLNQQFFLFKRNVLPLNNLRVSTSD